VQSEVANAQAKSPFAELGRRYLSIENTSRSAKPKLVIGVNPIRALITALLSHAHFGHGKVAIIGPAERMNSNSANALLKLLEEPADDTLLILVSSMPTRLLATIRSRCMRVEFAPPAVPVAVEWLAPQVGSDADALLALAGGAPLSAAALSENGFPGCRDEWLDDVAALASHALDPLTCAAHWHQAGSAMVLEWLHGLVADLIGLASGATPPRLFNLGRESEIRPLAGRIPVAGLHDLFDTIGRRRHILDGSVDERLLLEDIVIKLRETLIGRGSNTIQLAG
jgi:DNA polymerase-3 subunit delta'